MWHRSSPARLPLLSAAFRILGDQVSSPCPSRACLACKGDTRPFVAWGVCACGSCQRRGVLRSLLGVRAERRAGPANSNTGVSRSRLGCFRPQIVRCKRSTVSGENNCSPVSTHTRAGTCSMMKNFPRTSSVYDTCCSTKVSIGDSVFMSAFPYFKIDP
jgi:hypothetical protein